MNTIFSINLIKGRIKKIIIINIILFFLIYQALFIYGLKIFFYESNSPEYFQNFAKEIQTTPMEDETVALIKKILVLGHELYESSEKNGKLFTDSLLLNDKVKAFVDANSGTIELNIINPLVTSATVETALSTKKIIVKDGYTFNHLRKVFKVIYIYCVYQIEKKDKAKVISGINALTAFYSFSQKGIEGSKPLISCMISTALLNLMAEIINKTLESEQLNLTAKELDALFNKLKILPAISDNFFDYMVYEKILIKDAIKNYIMFHYNQNFIKMLSTMVTLKTFDLYYGRLTDQYETIMNNIIDLKNKPYPEVIKNVQIIQKDLEYSHLSIFTSKYHPIILIVVPNCQNAYTLDIISRLKLKGILIKILALKEKILTGKVPQTLDELIKISSYNNTEFNIAIDDFTQKPLIYRVSETGEILIYSAGPDIIDNGGKFSSEKQSYQKTSIDIKL